MMYIDGPVGVRWGAAQARNLRSDQERVFRLLASISAGQGGSRELFAGSSMPLFDNGRCHIELQKAILRFQQFQCRSRALTVADGVVDSGGNTLRVLNSLANGGVPGPAPSLVPSAPKQVIPLDPPITALGRVFTHSTPWTFTSSGGFALGYTVMTVGGGRLYLRNESNGEQPTLLFGAGGASLGLNGGPDVSFSFATSSMWSTGVGRIRARTPAPLQLNDMQGPMCVVSFTGAMGAATLGEGLAISIYMLGLPTLLAIGNLLLPALPVWVVNAASTCRAMGMMVGRAKGADVSAAVTMGYAW